MEPEERDMPRTIPMSWIQQCWQFIDLSHDHHSMARWIPPPKGFHAHMLNPYPRHRISIVPQNWDWWVIQECLGRFHVGMLATRSWSRNLQRWPYVLKFQIHLLRKTLVSKFDLKHDPLSMEPEERDTRSTIPMSWIQRNQQFVDWRHGHDSMARSIPPPTRFHGHLSNPYKGHRIPAMHQN